MIIKENPIYSVISGISEEDIIPFKVDGNENNSRQQRILREGIYDDPIGAICREIATNCKDAHKEIGTPDKAIEIHFIEPNNINFNNSSRSIVFKDYGIGMNPERINVFVNYTATTKGNSNDQSGGWGVGGKTPHAYTDLYTIITVCNNIEYTYIAFKRKDNCGALALLNKVETDKPSGTEIIVPFENEEDDEVFAKRCLAYTKYWKIKPKWFGKESPYIEKESIATFSKIINFYDYNQSYNYNKSNEILIDEIPYPLKSYDDEVKEILNLINKAGYYITIEVNIGQLELPISREHIVQNKESERFLNELLVGLNDKLNKIVDIAFKKISSYKEACRLANNLNRNKDNNNLINIAWQTVGKSNKKYNDIRLVTNEITLRYHIIYRILNGGSWERKYKDRWKNEKIKIDEDYLFVDTKGISIPKNRQIYRLNDETSQSLPRKECYLIKPIINKNEWSQSYNLNQLKEFKEIMLLTEAPHYSSIKTIREKREKGERKAITNLSARIVYNEPDIYNTNKTTWGEVSSLTAKDGNIYNGELYDNNEMMLNPYDFIVVPMDKILVGYTSKSWNRSNKDKDYDVYMAYVIGLFCNRRVIIVNTKHLKKFEKAGFTIWGDNTFIKEKIILASYKKLKELDINRVENLILIGGNLDAIYVKNCYKLIKRNIPFGVSDKYNGDFVPYIPKKIMHKVDAVKEHIKELDALAKKHKLISRFLYDQRSPENISSIRKMMSY